MNLDDVERAFWSRYPEGKSRQYVGKNRKPGLAVKFKETGQTYRYTGTPQEIARRLKLDLVPKDEHGEAIMPKPNPDGSYTCRVERKRNKFLIWTLSIGSPFTGMTLTFAEKWKDELGEIWSKVECQLPRGGHTEVAFSVEELNKIREAHDKKEESLRKLAQGSKSVDRKIKSC
jgi:hypothetical protein